MITNFESESGYYLELLTVEKIKLLRNTLNKKTEDKKCKMVPSLEINPLLIHFNIVNNDYQQDSGVLLTFAPNKLLGQLLEISTTNFIF